MTKREAAIVSAYTGFMLGKFSDMQAYIEELLGHPCQTIEFAVPGFKEKIREASKRDFVKIKVGG